MYKSKYRGLLADDKLRFLLVMGTEPPFNEVAFEALWSSVQDHSQKKKKPLASKKLRGKKTQKGIRKKRKNRFPKAPCEPQGIHCPKQKEKKKKKKHKIVK